MTINQLFYLMAYIQLSNNICGYFENTHTGSRSMLYEEELKICKDYEPKRLNEFYLGRYCAHQCLDQLDASQPILKSDMGSPIWPKNIIGSISHSDSLTGAIVSYKTNYKSLGLDIESYNRVDRSLWKILFTRDEINLLNSLPSLSQSMTSTLFFSLKESFYKMQFQITSSFMDFLDCEITVNEDQYCIRPLVKLANLPTDSSYYQLHYKYLSNGVICCISMPHETHFQDIQNVENFFVKVNK